MMNFFPQFHRIAAALVIACSFAQADVTVSNVRSAQRFGTKLVDIDYNLAGTPGPFTVSVRISKDGGTTFTVPATSLTGAFGPKITAGTNKRITWNSGVDLNNQYNARMRFEVTATENSGPVTYGDMVKIAGGSFQMGDATGVGSSGELPVHKVWLRSFYMAKYETTKELWDSVRAWGMANGRGYDLAEGFSKAYAHPVHSVSWYDMVKWCNARSEKEKLVPCYYTDAAQTMIYKAGNVDIDNTMVKWNANGYRLPTEAEWEKAARGGRVGKNFPWGDNISQRQANYVASSSYSYDLSGAVNNFHPRYSVGGSPYTSPVGSFPAYGGLHDMTGNIWEWCWDWYGDYPSATQTFPKGPISGSARVARGGSWNNIADRCCVAYRINHFFPSYLDPYLAVGFRPVRSSVP